MKLGVRLVAAVCVLATIYGGIVVGANVLPLAVASRDAAAFPADLEYLSVRAGTAVDVHLIAANVLRAPGYRSESSAILQGAPQPVSDGDGGHLSLGCERLAPPLVAVDRCTAQLEVVVPDGATVIVLRARDTGSIVIDRDVSAELVDDPLGG